MQKKPRKVAVALMMSGISGHDELNGIFEHLHQGHRWQITLYRARHEFTAEAVRTALQNGIDGFLVAIPGVDEALTVLATSAVPTVLLNIQGGGIEKRQTNIFHVKIDSDRVGREAASEFLRQGRYESYGFVGSPQPANWSSERGRGFAKRLSEKLEQVSVYDYAVPMTKWLLELKKPCAILAACDDLAYKVIDTCNSLRLRVPHDVAVMGVDNDKILCENSEPRLSSIQPDFVTKGRLAAQLLERMMTAVRRKHPAYDQAQTRLVNIREIVRRESTPPESFSGMMVQDALAYIKRKALSGIGVDNVASHLKISRSLLDTRFREHLGSSVYDNIIRIRLEEAERRLCTTDDRIGQIAVACGWKNPNALKNLFKRKYGLSMREWRRNHRA